MQMRLGNVLSRPTSAACPELSKPDRESRPAEFGSKRSAKKCQLSSQSGALITRHFERQAIEIVILVVFFLV